MSCGLLVLVVDDHPVNRRVLTEIFEHLGCTVTCVDNGDAALAAADRPGAFDLICLDRHMPGMGGDEILARLPRDAFVAAWSTDTTNMPSRYDGVLSKPITIEAAAKIAATAQLAGLRRRLASQAIPALRLAV
jgi:two-component system capsular synthesis sensor histidine kinase RcsC